MVAAGLVARRARERGLQPKPWVKTSFAPGSQVVSEYLQAAGLQEDLDALGFHLVGYGCTTCIGNSGPLPGPVSEAVTEGDLVVCSVLSGNRNFEGRVNPQVKANYLASPPLVVAYALAGSMHVDLTREPLATDADGKPVHLRDLWPAQAEVTEIVHRTVTREAFRAKYANVFAGDEAWQSIEAEGGLTYAWPEDSTYVQHPPYFEGMGREAGTVADIENAHILALLGDFRHHRPYLTGRRDHPHQPGRDVPPGAADHAARLQLLWLAARQPSDHDARHLRQYPHPQRRWSLKSRGASRAAPGRRNRCRSTRPPCATAPRVSRWWWSPGANTAPAPRATGPPRARGYWACGRSIAESFERIHRSNLVGMGVVPLQFPDGTDRRSLGLDGDETVTIRGLADGLRPRQEVTATFTRPDGSTQETALLCRIDTDTEIDYMHHGGVLHYVLRQLSEAG